MSIVARALLALAGLALGACQFSPGVVDRTIAYNKAIAESTNVLLLLNTVRASQRYPTYYSRVTTASTNVAINPDLTLGIPFGPDAVTDVMTATAKLFGNVQSSIAIENLDNQKFYQGLMAPVGLDLLAYYYSQGWPRELLLMLVVDRVTMAAGSLAQLSETMKAECLVHRGDSAYCAQQAAINEDLAACPPKAEGTSNSHVVTISNNPSTNTLTCFRGVIRSLLALRLEPIPVTSFDVLHRSMTFDAGAGTQGFTALAQSGLVVEPLANGTFAVCKREAGHSFALVSEASSALIKAGEDTSPPRDAGAAVEPSIETLLSTALAEGEVELSMEKANSILPKSCTDAVGSNGANKRAKLPIRFVTRSLDDIVYYLGEHVRRQHSPDYGDGIREPFTIFTWQGREPGSATGDATLVSTNLFVVHREQSAQTDEMQVEFKDATYSIPASCPDHEPHCARPDHASLQILSFLSQLWGLRKEAATVPAPPNITVISPN